MSINPDHVRAAGLIVEAAATGKPISPIRETFPSFTVDDAYAVQQLVVERAVSAGNRIVGRKIGLTSKAVQKQIGVDQPDFGTLTVDMAFGDSEEIPFAKVLQPKAEAEIALVMEKDLTQERTTLAELISAVAYALPAIEVVGSRIANWNIRLVDTVADNASSGAFVLGGSPKKLTDFDARDCEMTIERRNEQVSVGNGAACLGHPLVAAVWLANTLAKRGAPLRAGDIILTGALGPMVAAAPKDVMEARISGLGTVRAVFGGEQ